MMVHGLTHVIEGGAHGADAIAQQVAHDLGVPVLTVHAAWSEHGKAAGPLRNRAMLHHAPDRVIAFHEDIRTSKGTKDMVQQAQRAGVPVHVITTRQAWTCELCGAGKTTRGEDDAW
jgi:hypothetical protein